MSTIAWNLNLFTGNNPAACILLPELEHFALEQTLLAKGTVVLSKTAPIFMLPKVESVSQTI